MAVIQASISLLVTAEASQLASLPCVSPLPHPFATQKPGALFKKQKINLQIEKTTRPPHLHRTPNLVNTCNLLGL